MLLQANSDNVSEHQKNSIATYWHNTFVCTNPYVPPTHWPHHLLITSHPPATSTTIQAPCHHSMKGGWLGQLHNLLFRLPHWTSGKALQVSKNLLRCPSTKLRLAETTHADVPPEMFIFCIWSFPCANQLCQFVLWALSSDPYPSI